MKRLILIAFSIYGLCVFTGEKHYLSRNAKKNTSNTDFITQNKVYSKICDYSMRGKHLFWDNNSPTLVTHIIINESGNNIHSFIIEKLDYREWTTIYTGTEIGTNCVITLHQVCEKDLRLKVLKSYHIPKISSFQIYTNRNLQQRESVNNNPLIPPGSITLENF
ncbi:MAG: hypothetical protein R3Y26_08395 [Rikenellaceae bacterium]